MNPNGISVEVGGSAGRWMLGFFVHAAAVLLLSPFISQRFVTLMAKSKSGDLATIAQLMAAGKLTPVIDRRYGLNDVPEAIRYLEAGHARGKVVITLQD